MDAVSASDAVLATRACAGDLEALAGLFERYRPALYAAAIRLLRNREDALDAVQETSVIALLRLGSLRDPAAVGGWLRAVVRSVCLMRLRRAAREAPQQEIEVAVRSHPGGCPGTAGPARLALVRARGAERRGPGDGDAALLHVAAAVTRRSPWSPACPSARCGADCTALDHSSALCCSCGGPPPSHADLERARRGRMGTLLRGTSRGTGAVHVPRRVRVRRRGVRPDRSMAGSRRLVGARAGGDRARRACENRRLGGQPNHDHRRDRLHQSGVGLGPLSAAEHLRSQLGRRPIAATRHSLRLSGSESPGLLVDRVDGVAHLAGVARDDEPDVTRRRVLTTRRLPWARSRGA